MQTRAPENEPKRPHTISIEDRLWNFAKDVGHGNVSLGVRFILQQAYEAAEATSEEGAEST